jgi:tRNA threonylcarbamoyladenosine biosynthesis protein TsaE
MAEKLKFKKKNLFITSNPSETIKLGKKIAKRLRPGDIIFLYGELGAGKTTLIKGIARGLGIKKLIISPSFVLVKEYPQKNFFHIDLYRIKDFDFLMSGLNEYLSKKNIVAIEWAEKIENLVKPEKNIIKIKINLKENEKREISVETN